MKTLLKRVQMHHIMVHDNKDKPQDDSKPHEVDSKIQNVFKPNIYVK